MLRYAEKVYGLVTRLGRLDDSRQRPQIAAQIISLSLFVMLLGRLGSLNALEQTRHGGYWRRILKGRRPPSADTLARVSALFDPRDIRDVQAQFYAQLKRNKALPAPGHGLMALILDGHESTCSYRRSCSGCLERTISTSAGPRVQYYHRDVAASLVGEGVHLLLDLEPQRRGEDEVAAASRLLRRIREQYPRAFDVVLADSLYARTTFLEEIVASGKHLVVVLKREDWALTQDVQALCDEVVPETQISGRTHRLCWDLEDLPWGALGRTVRVVRSLETTSVKRQLTEENEQLETSWMWLTTLTPAQASTRTIVDLGHRRWAIENEGFNEAVNHWHFDHVYHHQPTAMLVMLLLVMIAYNLLHVFYARNLKPVLRRRSSFQHVARQVATDLYLLTPAARAPT